MSNQRGISGNFALVIVICILGTTGCDTVPNPISGVTDILTRTTGIAGPGGGGSIGTAWTVDGKCQILLDWASQLQKEYPKMDLRHTVLGKIYRSGAANLFRDKYFVPVFGIPLDQMSKIHRNNIERSIFRTCQRDKEFSQPMSNYYYVISRPMTREIGSFSYTEVTSIIAEQRQTEKWVDQTLAGIKNLPSTEESFSQIADGINIGPTKMAKFWPSEVKNFISELESKRGLVAKDILNTLAQDVRKIDVLAEEAGQQLDESRLKFSKYAVFLEDSEKTGLKNTMNASVRIVAQGIMSSLISKMGNIDISAEDAENILNNSYSKFSKYSEFLDGAEKTAMKEKMDKKIEVVLAPLVGKRLESLKEIPLSIAGLKESGNWYESFSRAYGGFHNSEVVSSAEKEFSNHHANILKEAKAEFKAKQEALSPNYAGLNKSVELLDDIFPLVSDERNSYYKDFRDVVLNRIDSIHGEMLASRAATSQGNPSRQNEDQMSANENVDNPFAKFKELPNKMTDFPTKGYVFSILMETLYEGKLDEIPDDMDVRHYNISLVKIFNQSCGEKSVGSATVTMEYGSEFYRQTMKNPYKAMEGIFKGLVNARDTFLRGGGMQGVEEMGSNNAFLMDEGLEDGELFNKRYACDSPQSRKVRSNLWRLISERHKIAPEPKDEARFKSLISADYKALHGIQDEPLGSSPEQNLDENCIQIHKEKFSSSRTGPKIWCRCMSNGIFKSGLSSEDLKLLAASFTSNRIDRMKSKYPVVGKNTHGCYKYK